MLEEQWQEHKDNGLRIFVLMGEGLQPGTTPVQEDQLSWTNEGASFPILADVDYQSSLVLWNGEGPLGMTLLLGRGMKVIQENPVAIESLMD